MLFVLSDVGNVVSFGLPFRHDCKVVAIQFFSGVNFRLLQYITKAVLEFVLLRGAKLLEVFVIDGLAFEVLLV